MIQSPIGYYGKKDLIVDTIFEKAGYHKTTLDVCGGTASLFRCRKGRVNHTEIYNDGCGYMVNMFRALSAHDPDDMAERIENILYSEIELNSRRYFLKKERDSLLEAIQRDKNYYDPEIAADFIWMGSAAMDGVSTVYTPLEHFSKGSFATGHARGVLGKRITPSVLRELFRQIRIRFENISCICEDIRELLESKNKGIVKGGGSYPRPLFVFIDPPYLRGKKYTYYTEEKLNDWIQAWAIQHGDDPDIKIIVAGYTTDYWIPWPDDWQTIFWDAGTSYANTAKDTEKAYAGLGQECLWVSPSCLMGEEVVAEVGRLL